jgi:hypothetical protein
LDFPNVLPPIHFVPQYMTFLTRKMKLGIDFNISQA